MVTLVIFAETDAAPGGFRLARCRPDQFNVRKDRDFQAIRQAGSSD